MFVHYVGKCFNRIIFMGKDKTDSARNIAQTNNGVWITEAKKIQKKLRFVRIAKKNLLQRLKSKFTVKTCADKQKEPLLIADESEKH